MLRKLVTAAFVAVPLSMLSACEGCAPPPPDVDALENDIDRDGTPNDLDDDIDGDEVPNGLDDDMDGDGVPNAADDDPDGDGVPTRGEDGELVDETPLGGQDDQQGAQGDLDGDGLPNSVDNDDDGNGIPDGVVGDGTCDGGATVVHDENHDCDGYCFLGGEGGYQACDDGGVPGAGVPDSDGDGDPDPLDPDDDGDGVPDGDDGNPTGETPPDPVDTPPGECVTQDYDVSAGNIVPPRILLVVDKSGSMADDADGYPGSKWDAARDTLGDVVTSLEGDVSFGLMLYPNGTSDDTACNEGTVRVDVGDSSALQIVATLGVTSPGGGTPTATTLMEARQALDGLGADGGNRAVVLATDGGPNCNASLDGDNCRCVAPNQSDCAAWPENCLDDGNAIASAASVNAAGYPVFVIGIPGAENFRDVLNGMAQAGGTAQAGAIGFYDASSTSSLASALEDITLRVGACRFDLPHPVGNSDLTVTVAGSPVARDQSRSNGWDLVDSDTIELFGAACDAAVNGSGVGAASVSVELCPGG